MNGTQTEDKFINLKKPSLQNIVNPSKRGVPQNNVKTMVKRSVTFDQQPQHVSRLDGLPSQICQTWDLSFDTCIFKWAFQNMVDSAFGITSIQSRACLELRTSTLVQKSGSMVCAFVHKRGTCALDFLHSGFGRPHCF